MSSSLSVLVTGLTWSSFSCLPVVSVACANVKCFSCASSEMSLRVFCSFICRLPHFSTAELWHFIRLQGLYLVFPSFLQVLLQEQKFLIWMKSNLLIFFFFLLSPHPPFRPLMSEDSLSVARSQRYSVFGSFPLLPNVHKFYVFTF